MRRLISGIRWVIADYREFKRAWNAQRDLKPHLRTNDEIDRMP